MSQDTPAFRAATQSPDDEGTYVVERETIVVEPSLLARLGAEVFGSFVLVLAILGVALYGFLNTSGALSAPLAGGFAFLAAAAAVGHVSGGHFSPAVTLGAAIAGRTSWADLLPYWLAQVIGAVIAGLVLLATVPAALPGLLSEEGKSADLFLTVANGFEKFSPLYAASQSQVGFTMWAAVLVEVVVTALFVGVLLGVTDKRANRRLAPVAAGLALTVGLFIAAPIDNGSLNPARSLTAALFANDGDLWKQQWVFVVAPLVGAALAGLLYRAFAFVPEEDYLLGEREDVEIDEFDDVDNADDTDELRAPAEATSAEDDETAATAIPPASVAERIADAASHTDGPASTTDSGPDTTTPDESKS